MLDYKMDCGKCWDCSLSVDCPCNTRYQKQFKAEEGEFYDKSHYYKTINESCVGLKEDGSILFILKKNNIKEENRQRYKDILRTPSRSITKNRGSGAGEVMIDKFPKGAVSLCDAKGNPLQDGKKYFSVYYKYEDGRQVKRCQSNMVRCGVAGYFTKVGKLPCRMVAWSRDHLEKHKELIGLCEEIQDTYEELCPELYNKQKERADLKPEFRLGDTCFSTMTLNYDFRTATHKDKGDMLGVLSTLTILEDKLNNYEDFFLGLPEYKICFDLRDGDTIYFDAHEYHANTECKVLSPDLGIDKLTGNYFAGRIAVVCYLREKLHNCINED